MAKLGDICVINPKCPPLQDEFQVSFVPMQNVSEDGAVDTSITREYRDVKKGFTYFQNNDVLFAKITPCMENGKGGVAIGLTNGIGFGSTEFHILRPQPECTLSKWLYYLLSWPVFRKECEKNMTGSAGQKRVPKIFLENYKVPLPSLEEQRKIAAVLDKVSNLIALRKKQLAKLDELVKARFVEMFGGINRTQYITVNDVCSIITDGTHQPPKFVQEGIPFIFVSNLANDEVTYDAEKFITEDTYNELIKRTPIEIGDVLLTTVGSYGHPAVVKSNKKFLFQRHIAYLKPKRDVIDSEYLRGALLSADGQRQIEEKVKGIAQKTLNLSEIRSIAIPVPPMAKQKQFATFVAQVDKSKVIIQKALDETQTLFDSLMQKHFE